MTTTTMKKRVTYIFLMLWLVAIGGLIPASASTLPIIPVAYPDGQSISPTSPGLGVQVFAIAGDVAQVDFNDNYGNTAPDVKGDFDFQDAMGRLSFLPNGLAVLTYLVSNTADTDLIQVAGGAWLWPGQSETVEVTENGEVVPVHMLDVSDFEEYVTGPADLNPGGAVMAWVSESGPRPINSAPEPGAWLLTAMALVGVVTYGIALRCRN
jgi:hypothetical protein